MGETVTIGDRTIGPEQRCFVIAEIGLNHNGDPELARRLIDVAADAGVDAVKFQRRDVSELAIGEVLHAADDRFPSFGSTYYEIRRHLELDDEQFRALADHARGRGLVFLCTPFDVRSLNALAPLGLPACKLASHSVTNLPLIERHVTLDREMEGFDHHLSSDPAELVALVHDIRLVEAMLGDGDKRVNDAEWVTRRKYHVSLVTRREIAAGELIAADAITVKNPGIGLPPAQLPNVLGRRAARPIPADRCLQTDDVDDRPAGR